MQQADGIGNVVEMELLAKEDGRFEIQLGINEDA